MGRVLVAGLVLVALGWAQCASAAPARLFSAKDGPDSVSVQVVPAGDGWKLVVVRKGADGCDLKVEGPATMKGGSFHMAADDQGRPCDLQLTPKPQYAEFLENKCPIHSDDCRLDALPILQPH